MNDIKQQHDVDVQRVQMQVRALRQKKQKIKIYHGSTNATRPVQFNGPAVIDMRSFARILEINTTEKYVVVEPNVPMDKLVEATLTVGLVPPVVMEFPGITVGGGIQGAAGESSSFQAGLFHDTCLAYEMVLGNGELVTVSPDHQADLFYGTAGSYGSLGIMTLITLRLVPAKPFVQLTYQAVGSFAEAVRITREQVKRPVAFVDGILFSKNTGVIMTGQLTDRTDLPVASFRGSFDEWFYLHAQKISQSHRAYDEIIPLVDYLFRYDRGGFWVGRFAFRLTKIPYWRIFRTLGYKLFSTRSLYRVLHAAKLTQRYLVQDISLPHDRVTDFLERIDREFHVYPLWLCPLRPGTNDRLSPTYIKTDLVINIGVWGEISRAPGEFVRLNRALERLTADLGGRKVLYSYQLYSPDEFWRLYGADWYHALRKKYYAQDVFRDVYEKTLAADVLKSSRLKTIWEIIRIPFRSSMS